MSKPTELKQLKEVFVKSGLIDGSDYIISVSKIDKKHYNKNIIYHAKNNGHIYIFNRSKNKYTNLNSNQKELLLKYMSKNQNEKILFENNKCIFF